MIRSNSSTRRLRVADLDGVQLAHRERDEGAAVERVAVQLVAGCRVHVECEELLDRDRMAGGDQRLLDDDAVRATALEADQVTPVVEHGEVLPRHDHDDDAIVLRRRGEPNVVSRIGRAGAEMPGPAYAIAAWRPARRARPGRRSSPAKQSAHRRRSLPVRPLRSRSRSGVRDPSRASASSRSRDSRARSTSSRGRTWVCRPRGRRSAAARAAGRTRRLGTSRAALRSTCVRSSVAACSSSRRGRSASAIATMSPGVI